MGPITIVEMQYTSNILALVGDDNEDHPLFSSSKLIFWDSKLHSASIEISFKSKILLVRLNSSNIVVSTKDYIYIHDLGSSVKIKAKISIANTVHLGRIGLSPNEELFPFLVYSQSVQTGTVAIYDTKMVKEVRTVHCHKTPLLKLALNYFGSHFVTCSISGNKIRVFSLPNGYRTHTFCRGKLDLAIYCLNFSLDSNYIISSSESGLLSIFQLKEEKHQKGDKNKSIHSRNSGTTQDSHPNSIHNFFEE